MSRILFTILLQTFVIAQNNLNQPKPYSINLTISYPASLFTIVDDLSKWSEYCEEKTFEYWSKKFPITSNQSILLSKYSEIRKNYGWGYFESCFLTNDSLDEAISCLSLKIKAAEIEIIKKVLYAFREDFNTLWTDDNYLFEKKRKIESRLEKLNIAQLLTTIVKLYNVENPPDSIKVYLLYNPTSDNSNGGANGGIFVRNGSNISIEYDLMIMLHEITHTLSDSLNNMLFRIAEQQSITDDYDKHILHEAVDYTLFPAYFFEVYLGRQYDLKHEANMMKGKNEYLYLIYSLANEIYPDVKKAISNNESLDQQFILQMVELYKQNWKNTKKIQN